MRTGASSLGHALRRRPGGEGGEASGAQVSRGTFRAAGVAADTCTLGVSEGAGEAGGQEDPTSVLSGFYFVNRFL